MKPTTKRTFTLAGFIAAVLAAAVAASYLWDVPVPLNWGDETPATAPADEPEELVPVVPVSLDGSPWDWRRRLKAKLANNGGCGLRDAKRVRGLTENPLTVADIWGRERPHAISAGLANPASRLGIS